MGKPLTIELTLKAFSIRYYKFDNEPYKVHLEYDTRKGNTVSFGSSDIKKEVDSPPLATFEAALKWFRQETGDELESMKGFNS